MAVTVLFLVIFEANSDVPEFQKVEKFLVYQCLLLVADLLFFLFRSNKTLVPDQDGYEPMTQRIRRMSCLEIGNCCVSLLLYMAQIAWLLFGNYIYFNLDTQNYLNKMDVEEADELEVKATTLTDEEVEGQQSNLYEE